MNDQAKNQNSDGATAFTILVVGVILLFSFAKSLLNKAPVTQLPSFQSPSPLHQPTAVNPATLPTMFDRVIDHPRVDSSFTADQPKSVTMMCGSCGGRGECKRMCYRCGGDGTLDERPDSSAYTPLQRCHNCSGSGEVTYPCPSSCNNGYVTRKY